MERRNLLLGIGGIATISATGTLTGATIQNAVSPGVNTRVQTTGRLLVSAATEDDEDENGDDNPGNFPSEDGTAEVTEDRDGDDLDNNVTFETDSELNVTEQTYGTTDPFVMANQQENNDLEWALSVPNEAGEYRFPLALHFELDDDAENIDNLGVQYVDGVDNEQATANGYGADVVDNGEAPVDADFDDAEDGDQVSANEVASIISFEAQDGSNELLRISPDGESSEDEAQQPENTIELTGDSTNGPRNVDIVVDIPDQDNPLEDLAGEEGSIELIDTIFVGDNPE